MQAGLAVSVAAWAIRRGGELCLCVTEAMSQPPGASGTAELTDPECSPAPAPWVPTGSCGLPLAPALAEESAGASRPRTGRSLPAPSHPACRSALPHLGGGRMTWPRSGELRKGFGSGLHGFVKGLGLTLQGTPSGLPDPKRRGAGPVGPKRSSHLLNPCLGAGLSIPPRGLKRPSRGLERRCPRGSPPCVGGRGGAVGRRRTGLRSYRGFLWVLAESLAGAS